MLRINRVDGLIGINTTYAKLSMTQPPADFQLSQTYAKVKIHSEQPKVKIDQTQCFNEAGMLTLSAFGEDMAARGKQAVMESIAKAVSEGNRKADIKNGGNQIAEIAFENTFDNKQFNIEAIPKSRPAIDFVGGNVDIQVEDGRVNLVSKPNQPQFDVSPGHVEVFLQQKPDIKIEYVGNNIDAKI